MCAQSDNSRLASSLLSDVGRFGHLSGGPVKMVVLSTTYHCVQGHNPLQPWEGMSAGLQLPGQKFQ